MDEEAGMMEGAGEGDGMETEKPDSEVVALRRIIEIATAALAEEADDEGEDGDMTENGQRMPMRPAMEGNMPEQAVRAMALRNRTS